MTRADSATIHLQHLDHHERWANRREADAGGAGRAAPTPGELAAAAAPPGSKPYYGFPLIEGMKAGGWQMGAMTDPLQADTEAGCTIGDAYVQAPDGTRAGIVWEAGPELKFMVLVPPDEKRWGVYKIHVPRAVRTWEDFHDNFRTMLPLLEHLYSRRATPDG